MNPFFSIIIPLYNKEKHIANTLKACLNQTFKNFDVIIVNDGSNDNSIAIINSFIDSRINLISTQNQGVSTARNLGISMATGQYIVFLDADDYWEDKFLEHMVELISKFPNNHVFSCARKTKPYNTSFKYKDVIDDKEYFETNYFKASKLDSILHCSSSVFSNIVIKEIGDFNTHLKTDEDTDYWIRIGLKFNVVFSKKKLVFHTIESNDLTQKKRKHYQSIDYNKYLNKSDDPHFLYFLNCNIYSSIIKYKLSGNTIDGNKLKNVLDLNQLSIRKKIIVHLPSKILKILLFFKNKFSKEKLYY